jgi:hypothetical protein
MPFPDQPKETPIPPELDRWNWGAFLLNWVWGLGNSTYIALLMFVPIVNFVVIFVLGAKGSQWAWKNRLWANEEHFIRTQRNWARAGVAVAVGFVLLFVLMFYFLFSVMKNNDAYRISMREVRASERVVEVLGKPIEAGWFVKGNIQLNGSEGKAQFSIPVTGPKCSGTVISRSVKELGSWKVYLLFVRSDCLSAPIILINLDNIQIPGKPLDSGQRNS